MASERVAALSGAAELALYADDTSAPEDKEASRLETATFQGLTRWSQKFVRFGEVAGLTLKYNG